MTNRDVHLCGAQQKQIYTAHEAAMRLLASAHDIYLEPHARPGYVTARVQRDSLSVVAAIWVPDIPALFDKKALFEEVIELEIWDGDEMTLELSTCTPEDLFVGTFTPGMWEQILVEASKEKKSHIARLRGAQHQAFEGQLAAT